MSTAFRELAPPLLRSLDTDLVRGHFPGLAEGWTLFDNAGGSVPLRGVIEAISEHLSRFAVQLGASYELSVRAAERVDDGRRAMATLIGAEPAEILLTASTTASMNLLARALESQVAAGDEIIVTELDHETNVAPWERLAARSGATLRIWKLRPETMSLELEDLEALLGERTRLLAMTHCSNLAGEILDVRRAAGLAHAAGPDVRVIVDGVAYAPHRRIDVGALGCDFYGFSTYKTYGPHLGVLWGRNELLEGLDGVNHPFISKLPSKLEPGGVNYELASALPAIVDYLLELEAHHRPAEDTAPAAEGPRRLDRAFALIARHEAVLAERLLAFLRDHPKVKIRGPGVAEPERRVPTISFTVEGRRSQEIPPLLDAHKLAVRWGHFYAPRAVRALGLPEDDGVVRVSMVHFNTPEEVDRLVEALDSVL